MNNLLERIPPHNIEAERAVLGSMMLAGEAVVIAAEGLKKDDFYHEGHRLIFEAILELSYAGQPADLVTLTNRLTSKLVIDKVGGAVYLGSLYDAVPTAANIEYYSRIVAEKATLRRLINATGMIQEESYMEQDRPVEEILDEAERRVLEVASVRRHDGFCHVAEVLDKNIEQLEHLALHDGPVGIPTFRDLDKYLLGFHRSDFIICAARPAMGKTSFCINLAQKIATEQNIPTAVFSLEMSKEQLVNRMLSSGAMVDQQKLRSGYWDGEEWGRMVATAGILAEAPIYIDDTAGITVMEIRSRARKLIAEHGNLGLIVIDYLQLMQSHKRIENRQQEVSEISRSLKSLARELNVPVLALSQLSRATTQSSDNKPALSHLRESGSLEQDADCVLFIHRPEYYDPETEKKNIAEIIIAKHRHGPTGTVEMAFLAQFTKFVDLAR